MQFIQILFISTPDFMSALHKNHVFVKVKKRRKNASLEELKNVPLQVWLCQTCSARKELPYIIKNFLTKSKAPENEVQNPRLIV